MFVMKSTYDRAIRERDGARIVAQHHCRRAQDAADRHAALERHAQSLAEALTEARAELEHLRQPRGERGRFGAKVRA